MEKDIINKKEKRLKRINKLRKWQIHKFEQVFRKFGIDDVTIEDIKNMPIGELNEFIKQYLCEYEYDYIELRDELKKCWIHLIKDENGYIDSDYIRIKREYQDY